MKLLTLDDELDVGRVLLPHAVVSGAGVGPAVRPGHAVHVEAAGGWARGVGALGQV